ncbi:MAG: carboxypeptidase-like regulatory domain-containing protein, partial [Ferruginibacter sp.]
MEQRKSIIYTAADLQRYHSGSMNEAEMYALERAAMDDPFLSDALEGYENSTTAEKDILELEMKLRVKEEKKKKTIISFDRKSAWLSAAAVLALIFGTVYLTSKFNNKSDSTLAKNEVRKQEQDLAKNDSDLLPENNQTPSVVLSETDSVNANEGSVDLQKTLSSSKRSANSHSKKDAKSTDVEAVSGLITSVDATKTPSPKKPQAIAETNLAREERVAKDALNDEDVLKDKTPDADTKHKRPNKYLFSGTIVDEQGNPVAFASVSDSITNATTTTDVNGKFFVSKNDSIFNATIASVGYSKLKKGLKNNTNP